MTLKLNTKGFAAVEAILVVVILAILGGTGYYVYHANKKTDATLNAASQVSQSSPAKTTKKKTASSTASQKYFTIKEWNVKAPYTTGVDLTYQFTSDAGPNTAYISTKALADVLPGCALSGGGDIEKVAAADHYSPTDAPADSSSPTAQAYAATLDKNGYGHVGNYYYFYRHPQGLCGGGSTSDSAQEDQIGNLMNQAVDQVKSLLPKFQSE